MPEIFLQKLEMCHIIHVNDPAASLLTTMQKVGASCQYVIIFFYMVWNHFLFLSVSIVVNGVFVAL